MELDEYNIGDIVYIELHTRNGASFIGEIQKITFDKIILSKGTVLSITDIGYTKCFATTYINLADIKVISYMDKHSLSYQKYYEYRWF